MKGLTRELIEATVKHYMPDDVAVIMSTHTYYMAQAKVHPFIQMQIRAGIYDQDTIDDEFLSPMCAYVKQRTLDVDYELIINHMKDVDTILAIGYVVEMVLHEVHHFEEHRDEAGDMVEQVRRELDCNEQVSKIHPIVRSLSEAAKQSSETISRVNKRMESIPT